jgi:hypothetical protein
MLLRSEIFLTLEMVPFYHPTDSNNTYKSILMKTALEEICCEEGHWIHLAQVRVQWWVTVA